MPGRHGLRARAKVLSACADYVTHRGKHGDRCFSGMLGSADAEETSRRGEECSRARDLAILGAEKIKSNCTLLSFYRLTILIKQPRAR